MEFAGLLDITPCFVCSAMQEAKTPKSNPEAPTPPRDKVHITTRQLKKRLWKELTPHVRPRGAQLRFVALEALVWGSGVTGFLLRD